MGFNPTTLVFEIINFLVLTWLLTRLLYRPLRNAIADREQTMQAEREQTKALLSEVESLKAEWEQKNRDLVAVADKVRSEALADAVAEQGRMLTRAREEAAAERKKAERLLQAERKAAEEWVRSAAIERSTDLTGQMLLSLAPDAVDLALVDRLVAEIEQRGETLLGMERGLPEVVVEVVAAHVPREGVIDRLRGALSGALDTTVRLTVREDPELRAGACLRLGDRVIDASLSGHLQAFQLLAQDLAEGKTHDG